MPLDVIKWIRGWRLDKFFTKAEYLIEEFAAKAIEAVNNFKTFDAAHPQVLDVLTAIIPGTWDDVLKEKLRAAIPQILAEMKIIQTDAAMSINDFLLATLNEIKKLDDTGRGYKWFELAGRITTAISDGQLTDAEVKLILQSLFDTLNSPSP